MPYRKLDTPLDESTLQHMYFEENKSFSQIGKELGISRNTVAYNMEKFGLKARNRSEAMTAQIQHGRIFSTVSGTEHPWWKGNRTVHMGTGYLGVRSPGHPKANKNGYVLEHVLVWESVNGAVTKGSHIHHRNGNKHDNRIENLEMLTPKSHALVIPELQKRIFLLEERCAGLEAEIERLKNARRT